MLKKFIQKICKRFYKDSKPEKEQESHSIEQKVSDTYFGSICFGLDKDFNIDILGVFPQFDSVDTDKITILAEKYSQLLISINKGLLSKKILDILDNRYKTSEDHQEQLFLQNVLTFYELLEEELSKVQNKNGPLIRPSEVFNKS